MKSKLRIDDKGRTMDKDTVSKPPPGRDNLSSGDDDGSLFQDYLSRFETKLRAKVSRLNPLRRKRDSWDGRDSAGRISSIILSKLRPEDEETEK